MYAGREEKEELVKIFSDLYCNLVYKVLSQLIMHLTNHFLSPGPGFWAHSSQLPQHEAVLIHTPHNSPAAVGVEGTGGTWGSGQASDFAKATRLVSGNSQGTRFSAQCSLPASHTTVPPHPPPPHEKVPLTSLLPLQEERLHSSKILGEGILTFDELLILHIRR